MEHEKKILKKILPKNKMATNEKYKQSLKYLGGIIFHGLEYLIRHEVAFFYNLGSIRVFFIIFYNKY